MLIEHNLKFVTDFQDDHPVTMQMLNLPESMRITMLEGMLKELIGSTTKANP